MSYHPFDKEISSQVFDLQSLNAIVTDVVNEHPQYKSKFTQYQQVFEDKANQSSDENERYLLTAMSMICSIFFENSGSGHYKPFCIMDGRRSFLPEDLPSTWQNAICEIANKLYVCPLLKSRLLDVVNLAADKKDFILIKDIISTLGQTDVLTKDGYSSWWRMFSLLKSMGRGLRVNLEKEEIRLYEIFQSLSVQDDLQLKNIHKIARLVLTQGLLSENQRRLVADRLKDAARLQSDKSNYLCSEQLSSLAYDFYVSLGQDTEAYEMLRHGANSYIDEGAKRISEVSSAYFVRKRFCEKALQILRTIPNERRTQGDKTQIDELIRQIPSLGQEASMHMQKVETSVDTSNTVNKAMQCVQGLEVIDAITVFVMLCPFSYSDLRETAINLIRENPLTSMIQSSVIQDGRTVARSTSLDLNNQKDAENAIWKAMVQNHLNLIPICVYSQILPALRTILSEHRIPIEGLHCITKQSQFVSINRRASWAKSLMFGFDWDFSTALYCIVPQIEHMVRDALKQRNLQTTNISLDDIENEIGLSALLENHLEACVSIFGENVAYEMKMLFCDSWGPNLRNTVAHGLLDDGASNSVYAVYAWWFALKVCILGAIPTRNP